MDRAALGVRVGDQYSNYSQIFPSGDGGETKIAKWDCCQDRKFGRIPHLHSAVCNQWMAAELFLLLSHPTELSRGFWWAPLLSGQADEKKKMGCSLWFHSQRISKRDCGAACQTCSEIIITLSQVDELSCRGPTSRADWQYLLCSFMPLPTQSTVNHFSALTFSTVDHFSPEWTCLHQHRGGGKCRHM